MDAFDSLTRRTFLGNAARGLGSLALGSLLGGSAGAEEKWRGLISPPHFPSKAKRVIWLTMAAGRRKNKGTDPNGTKISPHRLSFSVVYWDDIGGGVCS